MMLCGFAVDDTCFFVVVDDVDVDVVDTLVVESNLGDNGITLTVGGGPPCPFLIPPAVVFGLFGRRGMISSRMVEVIRSSSSSRIVVGFCVVVYRIVGLLGRRVATLPGGGVVIVGGGSVKASSSVKFYFYYSDLRLVCPT